MDCITRLRHNADSESTLKSCLRLRDLILCANLLKHRQSKVYAFYNDLPTHLKERDASLQDAPVDTAFAAMTFSFGPPAATYERMDHQNFAAGFCVVTSLGEYDVVPGGYRFLKELEKFPANVSILLHRRSSHMVTRPSGRTNVVDQ